MELIDDVIYQNPTPASRSLHMLLRHCNHVITRGIVEHHTELPKYLASAIRHVIDLINPSKFSFSLTLIQLVCHTIQWNFSHDGDPGLSVHETGALEEPIKISHTCTLQTS